VRSCDAYFFVHSYELVGKLGQLSHASSIRHQLASVSMLSFCEWQDLVQLRLWVGSIIIEVQLHSCNYSNWLLYCNWA